MKLFLIFLGLAVAGLLGYKMEPALCHKVTGMAATHPTGRAAHPLESARTTLHPATLTPEQLPAKVMLKADVQVTDAASEVTLIIPTGNRVKLDRIEGANAVVSPGTGSYSGRLPIAQTDLMEQLAAAQQPAAMPTPTPEAQPPAVARVPATAPESPTVATQPAPAMTEPAMTEPPEPAPPPAEQAAPVPTAAPAAAATDPTAVIQIMQESIRTRQINEFALTQVLAWQGESDETVNGEVFQAGSLTYKAETIFGVKTIQAKALIKDGKVQRWIWPKSGLEIK